MDENKQLENIRLLGSSVGGRWGPVRLADPGRHQNILRNRSPAAPLPAHVGLPCGLGNPVSADGHRGRKGQSDTALAGAQRRTESVHRAADREFLLESHLLQRPGIRLCLPLAAAFVGTGASDDPCIPQNRSHRRTAANSLPAVADLCRLPERGGLVSEPINAKTDRKIPVSHCQGQQLILLSLFLCFLVQHDIIFAGD